MQSAPVQAGETPDGAIGNDATGNDGGIPGEAIVGLLAALGLGAVGYAAMRSKRRRDDLEPEDVAPGSGTIDTPSDARVTPAARTAPVLTPTAGAAMAAPTRPVPTARTGPSAAAGTPLPTSAEERSLLLDDMVAAEPDAANPFTSRKARRRRARLLLQGREAEARRNNASFDWRSYRPTGNATPAVPPLVTA